MTGKSFVLTVSQSKRLIAKGVAALPEVRQAMEEGMVAVGRGTTNAYVVEELLGRSINKAAYVSGRTLPTGMEDPLPAKSMAEVVLRKGQLVEGLSAGEAARQMGPGDVFIKGANALNYRAKIAGILMGHSTGGTIGSAIGPVVAGRVHLIVPVGMEKEVPFDIPEASRILASVGGQAESLMPVFGRIITELEAVRILFPVEAVPIGCGGILGAEGSVRLYVYGEEGAVENAARFIEALYSEPPFAAWVE